MIQQGERREYQDQSIIIVYTTNSFNQKWKKKIVKYYGNIQARMMDLDELGAVNLYDI